jgi:hypothetical protein
MTNENLSLKILSHVSYLALFFVLTLGACNKARNYPDAYVVLKGNKHFIQLNGKRNLMVHDPISLIQNKTYEDSTLIPLPSLNDKKIPGREIVFDSGHYKYSYEGYVLIKGNNLSVNLYDFETVDKIRKQYFYEWNGDYTLHYDSTKKTR